MEIEFNEKEGYKSENKRQKKLQKKKETTNKRGLNREGKKKIQRSMNTRDTDTNNELYQANERIY